MSNVKRVIEEYKKNKEEYLDNLKLEKTFKEKLKKRIPNILTKSRIVAPFLIIPTAIFGNFITATIIAIIFGLTDAFDGKLARKWNAFSEYGRKLDVISDKIFALGLVLPLLITNPIIILTTIVLEGVIATIATNAELNNNHPKSTMLGKIKTNFLYITLASCYLFKCINISFHYLLPLVSITNMVQIATAIQYESLSVQESIKKEIINEQETLKKCELEDEHKKQLAKIQQEIREYSQLKENLIKEPEKEKDFVKIKK